MKQDTLLCTSGTSGCEQQALVSNVHVDMSKASADGRLHDPKTRIRFTAQNPKRKGSDSWKRYEVYKKAETVAEALSLGCKKGDLLHDQSKGYLIIAQDPAMQQLRPPTAGSAPAKSSNLLNRLVANKPNVDEVARSVLPPREISSGSGASDRRQPASPLWKRPAEALLSPRKKAKTEVGEAGDVEVQYQDVISHVAESVQAFQKAADCPDEERNPPKCLKVGEVGDVEVQYQDVVTQVAENVQAFKKAADCPDEDVASTVPDESEEQDLQPADRKQQQQQSQQRAEGGEEDGAPSAAGALNHALPDEAQDLVFLTEHDGSRNSAARWLKDDSLENGDEKVTLLGGKQRRECSWTCGAAEFLDDLAGAIGYKLLFLLFVVEHVNRGFVADFSGQAESYVYKTKLASKVSISKLPWALKPVVGLISDVMPIGGYHKAPYMIGAVFVGSAAFLAAGAVPHSMLPVSLLPC
eukprot:s2456_g14.t3